MEGVRTKCSAVLIFCWLKGYFVCGVTHWVPGIGQQEQFDPFCFMGRSKRKPLVGRTEWHGAIHLSSGRSVQIGTNSTALTSLGSPEPGGAAYMAPEACLQPVHLDVWSEHEGGSCWRSASLQKPQRILPQEAETTSTASLLFAQCGE